MGNPDIKCYTSPRPPSSVAGLAYTTTVAHTSPPLPLVRRGVCLIRFKCSNFQVFHPFSKLLIPTSFIPFFPIFFCFFVFFFYVAFPSSFLSSLPRAPLPTLFSEENHAKQRRDALIVSRVAFFSPVEYETRKKKTFLSFSFSFLFSSTYFLSLPHSLAPPDSLSRSCTLCLTLTLAR